MYCDGEIIELHIQYDGICWWSYLECSPMHYQIIVFGKEIIDVLSSEAKSRNSEFHHVTATTVSEGMMTEEDVNDISVLSKCVY